MAEQNNSSRSVELTAAHRTVIAVAIRRIGVAEVARRLELSREATLGLVVEGAGSHRGTEAFAAQRLDRLEEGPTDAP